jgi:hypothetical protein
MEVIAPNAEGGCEWCFGGCLALCFVPMFLLTLNSDIAWVGLLAVPQQ